MTDIRASRCEELRQAVLELTPLVIGGATDAGRLRQALPAIARVRAVAALGDDGVTEEAYGRWVSNAQANLDALETAVSSGDGAAAWAAFTDQGGIPLLAQGCAGCSGW